MWIAISGICIGVYCLQVTFGILLFFDGLLSEKKHFINLLFNPLYFLYLIYNVIRNIFIPNIKARWDRLK